MMPRGGVAVSAVADDEGYGEEGQTNSRFQSELVDVKGPRRVLMQKLVMHSEVAFSHSWDCEWARNSRNTHAATFTKEQLFIATDFAAQQECKGHGSMTCGTSCHVNKAQFVVLSNPRSVNGKRIHDCDSWTFFLPSATKYKENDYFAHHACLDHIYEHYAKKQARLSLPPLKSIRLYTDGCPGRVLL